jgi:DNA-binding PadR family transcriptional regulator
MTLSMEYNDYVDYQPELVLITTGEEKIQILRNPLYMPILAILREGYKSVKEIKSVYSKHTDKETVPSDKSLYRHLKFLKEAGLVSEVGKRVYKDKNMTEKLFGRTAYFFYTRDITKYDINLDKHKKQGEILGRVLQATLDIPQPSTKCILSIIKVVREIYGEIHDLLFEQKIENVAEYLVDLPLDDLQTVVNDYFLFTLLLKKSEFKKEFEECLNIS